MVVQCEAHNLTSVSSILAPASLDFSVLMLIFICMRREKKYNYIYKTTNNLNGKYYIGMHSTDNLDDGYMGSGKRLWFSMNYHGKDNHSVEILEYYDTRLELKTREKELVNEDLLKEDLCMNLVEGGEGGHGFWHDEHKVNFIGGASKGRETTNAILKERYGGGEDWLSKFNGEISKKAWKDPKYRKKILKNLDQTGRTHSDETKRKMSEVKKGKYDGKNNPTYGGCWILKDGVSKMIKKETLNEYLEMGWVKGRKMK